jgi:hypothetical protein
MASRQSWKDRENPEEREWETDGLNTDRVGYKPLTDDRGACSGFVEGIWWAGAWEWLG